MGRIKAFTRGARLAALAAAAALAIIGELPAQVQEGQFAPGATWFVGPGGLTGTNTPGSGDTTIAVDTNLDGFPDTTYQLPAEIRPDTQSPARWVLDFHLSPSQDALFVQKSGTLSNPAGPCGQDDLVQVFLYQLDGPPLMSPFSGAQGVCLSSPIAIQPRFHDVPGACLRTMAMVAAATGGKQPILWADLAGGTSGVDSSTYYEGVTSIEFAPSGNAAFIVHGSGPAFLKYTFVDLCESRIGGMPGTQTLPEGVVTAHVVFASGQFFALVRANGLDVTNSAITLDVSCCQAGACCFDDTTCQPDRLPGDCTADEGHPQGGGTDCSMLECPSLVPEACCQPDGLCDEIPPGDCTGLGGTPQGVGTCGGVTCPQPPEACCRLPGYCNDEEPSECAANSGAPAGPGSTCFTTNCPVISFELEKSGPASGVNGGEIPYVITYRNTGSVTPPVATITDMLPYGFQVVAASAGAVVSGNTVTWHVENIPPAGSGQVTLTVRADCTAASLPNFASIDTPAGALGTTFAQTDTPLEPAPTDPVSIAIASAGANGTPLQGDDLVTHTITLTNPIALLREGLRVTFGPGPGMAFDSVLDAGGGTVDTSNPASWSWSGSLAGLAEVSIVVTTRVDLCTQLVGTRLNGGEIRVEHACAPDPLGVATPPSLPIRPRFTFGLAAATLQPPAVLESFIRTTVVQLARNGQTHDFRVEFSNPGVSSRPGVSLSLVVPSSLTLAANPPFVSPTDPGASWNNATRTITWSGTLAPQQSVAITWRATISNALSCSFPISAGLSDGACTLQRSVKMTLLREPPAQEHLVILGQGGLHTFRPGLDTSPVSLMCFDPDYPGGLGSAPNGDIWVAGLPSFRLNPQTLAIEGFSIARLRSMGMLPPFGDVAIDPANGTALFAGATSDDLTFYGAIRRFDPASGTATPVYDAPRTGGSPGALTGIVAGSGGEIGAQTFNRVARIISAGAAQVYSDPAIDPAGTLALDTDGDYIVSRHTLSGPAARQLAEIDPVTGMISIIVPDLNSLVPTPPGAPFEASAAGTDGDVYLATGFGQIARIERVPAISGTTLYQPAHFAIYDLEYRPGPCGDADGDGWGAGPGCAPGAGVDCDDADAGTYPGAPEINDGADNQCPGDPGSGIVDEISGSAGFTNPADLTQLCWPAQAGAAQYEVVRSTRSDFTAGCTRMTTSASCISDPAQPGAGTTFNYLVRALLPMAGSWGADSAGLERIVSCP